MLCAISDIHGHIHALEEALENVSLSGDNRLVLLGDYTDYGPRSGEVLRSIYGLQQRQGPEKEDVLIILGDAGVNYYLTRSDYDLKQELNDLPITLFLIQGNHEERPEEIDTYEERPWRGGGGPPPRGVSPPLLPQGGGNYHPGVGPFCEGGKTG